MHKADFDDVDTWRGSFAPFLAENAGSRWAKSLREPGLRHADDITPLRAVLVVASASLRFAAQANSAGLARFGADDVKEQTPGQERFAGDRGMGGGL